MPADFADRLRSLAEVIVRVGLDLREGQRLLVTDPFETQGVSRQAAALVEAVSAAARAAGAAGVEVIWGDESRLRAAAGRWPDHEFDARLAQNTAAMQQAVERGDALLFLQGSHPRLMDGVPPRQVAALRERCWRHYGLVATHLVAGRTNWTAVPAPTPDWAEAVFPDAAAGDATDLLWAAVFAACRVDESAPLAAWQAHLDELQRQRDELDARRVRRVRFVGEGTDLAVALAPGHRWCTAALATPDGRRFVANLPTEEIFTAPERASAEGHVRVARPVAFGGATIEGIVLEFRRGRVVRARASRGDELLRALLATDDGARRLGEVALVPHETTLARSGLHFGHPLLDENALPHIALGDAYPFTTGPAERAELNASLVHIDLPLAATVTLE